VNFLALSIFLSLRCLYFNSVLSGRWIFPFHLFRWTTNFTQTTHNYFFHFHSMSGFLDCLPSVVVQSWTLQFLLKMMHEIICADTSLINNSLTYLISDFLCLESKDNLLKYTTPLSTLSNQPASSPSPLIKFQHWCVKHRIDMQQLIKLKT